ncbi:MAG: hypothetical protein M1829_002233 [Trizodia sp. TS-e1964]|nr:MAG: hypothetical protein M1829_002233 [Trizodia sp. TS-e1964]
MRVASARGVYATTDVGDEGILVQDIVGGYDEGQNYSAVRGGVWGGGHSTSIPEVHNLGISNERYLTSDNVDLWNLYGPSGFNLKLEALTGRYRVRIMEANPLSLLE